MLTEITLDKIREKVLESLEWITDNEPSIWRTTELNICSHLRALLAERFSEYNVDVELIKYTSQRPDLCIHIRDTQEHNLAAFEVKIKPSFNEVVADLNKITTTYFGDPYRYQYGVLIVIGDIKEKLPPYDQDRVAIITVSGRGERKDSPKKLELQASEK